MTKILSFGLMLFTHKGLLILIFCLSGFFIFGNIIQAAEPGDVIINEIAWMGSSASSKDEWVELKNMTSQDIDISGWMIKGAASGGGDLIIPGGGGGHIISANNFYLISYYSIADRIVDPKTTVLDVIVGWRVKNMGNISLANANNGDLVLKDGEGKIIDTAKGDQWAAGTYTRSEGIYCSMERNTPPNDGSLAESWHTATDSQGFVAGAIDKGSPGAENSSYVPQDEEDNQQEEGGDEQNGEIQEEEPSAGTSAPTPINKNPIAIAGQDIITTVDQAIDFDASESTDVDSDYLIYIWNFGEGSYKEGQIVTHSYSLPGKYIVSLEVSDGVVGNIDTLVVEVYPKSISISEFMPNPEGNDLEGEWIEISNASNRVVDISSWQIDDEDGGSSPFIFPNNTFIFPKSFIVFFRSVTKISLNNTNDEVRLLYPSGEIADKVIYDSTKEGLSAALRAGEILWTEIPTPGLNNIIYNKSALLSQRNLYEKVVSSGRAETKSIASSQIKVVDNPPAFQRDIIQEEAKKIVREPRMEDLDNIFEIKEALAFEIANEDRENNFETKNVSQKEARTDIMRTIQKATRQRIFKDPRMILLISGVASSALMAFWVVGLGKYFKH